MCALLDCVLVLVVLICRPAALSLSLLVLYYCGRRVIFFTRMDTHSLTAAAAAAIHVNVNLILEDAQSCLSIHIVDGFP